MLHPHSPRRMVNLVDDEVSVLRSAELLLNTLGYDVLTFSDAADFLERYRPQPPCCVIIDLRMPGLNGDKLIRSVRQRDWKVPVILTSGVVVPETIAEALRIDAVQFLAKPYTSEDLQMAVEQAMEVWT